MKRTLQERAAYATLAIIGAVLLVLLLYLAGRVSDCVAIGGVPVRGIIHPVDCLDSSALTDRSR